VGARENSEIYYSVTGVFPFTPLRSEWCRSEECPLKLLKCCSNLYQCSVPHMRLPLRRRVGCGFHVFARHVFLSSGPRGHYESDGRLSQNDLKPDRGCRLFRVLAKRWDPKDPVTDS
jgi:hypothetical protein